MDSDRRAHRQNPVCGQPHVDARLTSLARWLSGAIRPVVGLHVPFAELPAALEAMGRRETLGRVVVEVA